MDDFKLKQIKREIKLNQLVKNFIKENSEKIKIERKTIKKEKIELVEKKKNLNMHKSISKSQDRMPYALLGLIESEFFLAEEKENENLNNKDKHQEKIKEIGCGLLLDNNIVLIPAKNLIYDVNESLNNRLGDEYEKGEKTYGKSYRLTEAFFIPINISNKYRSFLPSKIKVIDYFTPLLEFNQEKISDEERLLNSWGLAVLDFPLGEFIQFILDEDKLSHFNYPKRNLKIETGPNKKLQNLSNQQSSTSFIEIDSIDNMDLLNSEIFFLESIFNRTVENVETNLSLHKEISSYSFKENFYDIKFDDNLIFLRSLSTLDYKSMNTILPGIILSYVNRKYYLIGMNTNILIKINENNNEENNSKIEGDDLFQKNELEITHRIGVRFYKDILDSISEKIDQIKSNSELLPQAFSKKLFKLFVKTLNTKKNFLEHLRDNCKKLSDFIKEILNESNTLKLTNEEKEMLGFNQETNAKAETNSSKNFIKFSLSLIWNNLSNKTSSTEDSFFSNSDLENSVLNLEALNIGLYPGSDLIGEIIKNSEKLICLNLKSNQIFSNGLKNLIKPIFNSDRLKIVGKDLRYIHLDNNKLSSKSLKYLRHILKVTTSLKSLTLNHNYIAASGLRHLVNALKSKDQLECLGLCFNMLGKQSGKYLHEILKQLVNLKELDIQSNNLTDTPIPFILSGLKTNNTVESIYLGNNFLTKISAENIADYLIGNKRLLKLWLNNNPIQSEGVTIISKSLGGKYEDKSKINQGKTLNNFSNHSNNSYTSYKYDGSSLSNKNFPVLIEINLANVNSGDEGAQNFFMFIKNNKNIQKIIFNSNNIGDIGCVNIAAFLSNQSTSEDENNQFKNENDNINQMLKCLSLSNNKITDEGAKILSEQFLKHKSLKEIKLNSNLITDEGAELLLYSILCNNSIVKFHIENNRTTWRDKNLDIKNIRSDIQIFF